MRSEDRMCSIRARMRIEDKPQQAMPADPRVRALCRPSNYGDLSILQKREIDRELNLLDWNGV